MCSAIELFMIPVLLKVCSLDAAAAAALAAVVVASGVVADIVVSCSPNCTYMVHGAVAANTAAADVIVDAVALWLPPVPVRCSYR